MKKLILVIFISLVLIITIHSLYVKCFIKYPSGKDTLAHFGNGTYQIFSGAEEYVLFNVKRQMTIVEDVYRYKIIKNNVYIFGFNPRYTILNYKEHKIEHFLSLNEMPEDIKKIFKDIKRELNWDLSYIIYPERVWKHENNQDDLLKQDIIRCIFDRCFETSFKHDLTYTKEEKHYKYFIQGIEVVRNAEFFNVSISAWPFEGKIVCKDIKICVIPNKPVD